MSAWDRLETENDLFVLTGLLLEWLEHLRAPALGKDAITYIVIHCDNVETAISKVYFIHDLLTISISVGMHSLVII